MFAGVNGASSQIEGIQVLSTVTHVGIVRFDLRSNGGARGAEKEHLVDNERVGEGSSGLMELARTYRERKGRYSEWDGVVKALDDYGYCYHDPQKGNLKSESR